MAIHGTLHWYAKITAYSLCQKHERNNWPHVEGQTRVRSCRSQCRVLPRSVISTNLIPTCQCHRLAASQMFSSALTRLSSRRPRGKMYDAKNLKPHASAFWRVISIKLMPTCQCHRLAASQMFSSATYSLHVSQAT